MATKSFKVSDLTGKIIEGEAATVIVHDHPLIQEPVQLDADLHELETVGEKAKDYVLVEVVSQDGERERLVLDLPDFDGLFSLEVDSALQAAEPYQATSKPQPERVNHKVLPHAGMPHKGRVSPEEAETVRENLTEVNLNRVDAGYKPIDQTDPKMIEKYGFTQPLQAAPPRPAAPRPAPPAP